MNKSKRRICVVVNSRANYGRIKATLGAIKNHPDLELQLIVGASTLLYRFGNAIDVIRNDGFEPIAQVYSIIEGENPTTMAKSTGLGIIELSTQFENIKPDIVLTVADRFETIATAIASSYMNIFLAHTQGGEVTGSIDESVRHAITKLAHIHFPATENAAKRLIKMGELEESVIMTGCPSIDAISHLDLTLPIDLLSKYGGVGSEIDLSKPYFLVLQHPVTTEFGSGLEQIKQTIEAISRLNYQTIWLWPNVDAGSDDISKGLRIYREQHGRDSRLHFYRNFPVEDYARLMNNAACIIGNSSSAIREGAFLGTPAVNIGTRQTGRERAENVIDVDYKAHAIEEAIKFQVEHGKYKRSKLFGDGKASEKIVNALAEVPIKLQKRLTY